MPHRRRYRVDPLARERARREQVEARPAATDTSAETSPPAGSAVPEPRPAEPKPIDTRVKFTALLEVATADRFERLTNYMRPVGRLAGGRYPSRADVLRAVLLLMEADPDLRSRVRDQVQADLSR